MTHWTDQLPGVRGSAMLARLADEVYAAPLHDVCVDPAEYARTALPDEIWRGTGQIFLHCGLFAAHDLLPVIPDILSYAEIPSPHRNLQERFFTNGRHLLASNVIGTTRVIHNMTLLRLLGVRRHRLSAFDGLDDWPAVYRRIVDGLRPEDPITRAVFSFHAGEIAAAWPERCRTAACSGPALNAVLVQADGACTLLVHLTSVYGTQVVPFADVLRREYGLRELLIFGACGALAPEIGLHDTVFPRRVRGAAGETLSSGNMLLPMAERYPAGLTGLHNSHIADAGSALCIPGEGRGDLIRLAGTGVGVIDLELGPLSRFLVRHPGLRWGAALHVSDRPLHAGDQLGRVLPLGRQDKAMANEIACHAALAAGRSLPEPRAFPDPRRPRRRPPLVWQRVSGGHPLTVWETAVPSQEGALITVHAMPIPLEHFRLTPLVNRLGQDYAWQDGIVRGTQQWDNSHMLAMNRLFRRSPAEFLGQCHDPACVVAVLNANGNLYWNLGHAIYAEGRLYHHARERLRGPQTAVLHDDRGIRLSTFDPDTALGSIRWAVTGCRIVRGGQPVDLLSHDPDTGRPVLSEFYGDMSHVLRGFGLGPSLARRIFAETAVQERQGGKLYYTKGQTLSPTMRAVVSGSPLTVELTSEDDAGQIESNLELHGYRHAGRATLTPGTFAIHHGLLSLAYRRATLGHSVIASVADDPALLVVNTYTDSTRKGFTVEDTARLVLDAGTSLGYVVEDALIISSSGDPRIILSHGDGASGDRERHLTCIEANSQGETLLFKGGLRYGLSSVFIVQRHA